MKDVYLKYYLDKRRIKSNKKFPLKFRVYTTTPKKQKMYITPFDFTEEEYQRLTAGKKLTNEERSSKLKLDKLELEANEIIQNLEYFTFENFERKFFNTKDAGATIFFHYKEQMELFKQRGAISTLDTYKLSLKAIQGYLAYKGNQSIEKLKFVDINVNFLEKLEVYFIKERNYSTTTISIYLRALRAIFNKARAEKEINEDIYPFGKRRYVIPSSKGVKKALTSEQLSRLFKSEPLNSQQEKAKDFWFLSFACNGINIKDLLKLKQSDVNLKEETLRFIRSKTKTTTKQDLKYQTIYLNEYSISIFKKYGTLEGNPNMEVFDALRGIEDPEREQRVIKNFTKAINQNLKKLSINNGLPDSISTYWARHSFATNSVRKGASMEFMQDSLGHNDLRTTLGYFAGFENETKKEFSKSIMDFEN